MQEEIESIALAVRKHWELDLSPISNLQLTLEESSIVITGFDTVDRKIDAFSQWTLIDDGNVFFVAVRWHCSMQAMIYRAHQLKAITDNQYQYMMRQVSKKGWRTNEPGDTPYYLE